MRGLFGTPKSVTAPVIPDPEAIPTVADKPAARKRSRGRSETVITGELEPVTTKKTLLG